MKLLVVTADDLGASRAVNEAIERAAAGGVLTQAGLLATGEALDDAVRRLRGALPLGLHLCLTEGRALAGPVRGLTDRAGRFLGLPRLLLAARFGRLDLERVRAELAAQVERVRAAGVPLAHIDSHHHAHVLPGLLPLALELAHATGAGAVRVPDERGSPAGGRWPARAVLRRASRGARERVRAAGLATSDHFRGLSLQAGAPARFGQRLLSTLAALPDGSTELMLHPRQGTAGEAEVAALLDPAVREALRRADVRPVSWSAVPRG